MKNKNTSIICISCKNPEPKVEIWEEEMSINGTDDPQYSGGYFTAYTYHCLDCGETFTEDDL